MKKETSSKTKTKMKTPKNKCGCGERALKLIRGPLKISKEELSDDYIKAHHAKATARALYLKLTKRSAQ